MTHSASPQRAIFTIAIGRTIYLQMAKALARSVALWNPPATLPFYLITDARCISLPEDLQFISLIPINSGQYGNGFTPKLHLDRFAPAVCSLFIDADCLCAGSLDPAFCAFQGRAVATIGAEIATGEWGGADVARVCEQLKIPALPRFNGGVYYLEKREMTTQIFETARALLPKYRELGFEFLRGAANEEMLVSVAMALHGQKPITEDGTIMNSLLAAPGGIEIDVFKGRSLLRNPKSHPRHNPWYLLEELRPSIVHFCGSDPSIYPYGREIMRLDLVLCRRWPVWLATLWTNVAVSYPLIAWMRFKDTFRPAFHRLFGPRKLRPTERI
jgi:hypothetical protein